MAEQMQENQTRCITLGSQYKIAAGIFRNPDLDADQERENRNIVGRFAGNAFGSHLTNYLVEPGDFIGRSRINMAILTLGYQLLAEDQGRGNPQRLSNNTSPMERFYDNLLKCGIPEEDHPDAEGVSRAWHLHAVREGVRTEEDAPDTPPADPCDECKFAAQ